MPLKFVLICPYPEVNVFNKRELRATFYLVIKFCLDLVFAVVLDLTLTLSLSLGEGTRFVGWVYNPTESKELYVSKD